MNFKLKKTLSLIFVYLLLAVMYLPIIVLIIFSFTKSRTMKWDGFTFDLYLQLFKNTEIMSAIGNTLIIAVVSSALAAIIGTISAVGIFYLKRRTKAAVNFISQVTVMNADIVTAVAFMLFFVAVKFIPDGFATLIIAHTVVTTPYVILAVLPRLSQLNPNLYEAGLDLGAGPMRTLFTVIFPQLIPGIISGFALAFTLSLDDFVITLFNRGSVNTISTYLYLNIKRNGLKPVLRAMSAMIFVVVAAILVGVNVYSKKRAKKNSLLMMGR